MYLLDQNHEWEMSWLNSSELRKFESTAFFALCFNLQFSCQTEQEYYLRASILLYAVYLNKYSRLYMEEMTEERSRKRKFGWKWYIKSGRRQSMVAWGAPEHEAGRHMRTPVRRWSSIWIWWRELSRSISHRGLWWFCLLPVKNLETQKFPILSICLYF